MITEREVLSTPQRVFKWTKRIIATLVIVTIGFVCCASTAVDILVQRCACGWEDGLYGCRCKGEAMNVERAFASVRSPNGQYEVSAYAWEEFVDITLANAETHEIIFHHNFVQEADPIVTERNVEWAEDSSSFTVRYNSLLSARETKCIYQYVIEPATFSLTCEGEVVPQTDPSLNSP